MWQAVVAYLIVAGAAAWIAWSRFLPRSWRRRVRGIFGGTGAPRAADPCGCEREML